MAISFGNKANNTFEPSRGLTGIRLKRAKYMFMAANCTNAINHSPETGKALVIIINNQAIKKLISAPEAAIKAVSRTGSLRLKGSYGAGFPHPNRVNKIAKTPNGSRWARGSRVSLPFTLGVGSPNLSAVQQ